MSRRSLHHATLGGLISAVFFTADDRRRAANKLRREGLRPVSEAGDTGLITDMQLLKGKVDVAVLPIGDRFTMGPEDAVTAVEFIEPQVVIPCHYDTWPPIEQDAEAFAAAVGDRAHVEIMKPGDRYDF